jgi:hypothetical protein
MLSLDEASAAQQAQQGAETPGATPQMTPLTAINRLRADLARGPGAGGDAGWEGQQQQMQSILSRLETRVRWAAQCFSLFSRAYFSVLKTNQAGQRGWALAANLVMFSLDTRII